VEKNGLDKGGRRRVTVGPENDYTLAWETLYDNHGQPFGVLTRQMPRINDNLLQCVFYLYPSIEEAKKGERVGGTGFFVYVRDKARPDTSHYCHFYAVTCLHVIEEGATVIRLNSWPECTIKPLTRSHWIPHPKRVDIAIAPVNFWPTVGTHFYAFDAEQIITPDVIKGWDVGIGDEVMMLGRFSEHDGGDYNMPSARSGIISMMPHPRGRLAYFDGEDKHDIFLVEMRSLFGFSGSPMFWQLPLIAPHLWGVHRINFQRELAPDITGPWLLGVDCGKFPYDVNVHERDSGRKTDLVARAHSGHSVVAPGWELKEFLDREEFVVARKKRDIEMEASKGQLVYQQDSISRQKPN
jgi:hypothetical protein